MSDEWKRSGDYYGHELYSGTDNFDKYTQRVDSIKGHDRYGNKVDHNGRLTSGNIYHEGLGSGSTTGTWSGSSSDSAGGALVWWMLKAPFVLTRWLFSPTLARIFPALVTLGCGVITARYLGFSGGEQVAFTPELWLSLLGLVATLVALLSDTATSFSVRKMEMKESIPKIPNWVLPESWNTSSLAKKLNKLLRATPLFLRWVIQDVVIAWEWNNRKSAPVLLLTVCVSLLVLQTWALLGHPTPFWGSNILQSSVQAFDNWNQMP